MSGPEDHAKSFEEARARNRAAMQAAALQPKVLRDLPPADLVVEPSPDALKPQDIPVPWATMAREALASDDYLVRKQAEARDRGIPVPVFSPEFLAYTDKLREIANTGAGPLPTRPLRHWLSE